jgi:hypothetical protein
MDKIFDQEELYWLDDILPGTRAGRIRRISFARHVYIPKSSDEDLSDLHQIVCIRFLFKQKIFFIFLSIQPIFNPLYKSSDNEEKNLPNIVEVGLEINNSMIEA